ncbi:MAG: LacI family DNA-binding transcriptional regulator [Paracoccaceae bacterium]
MKKNEDRKKRGSERVSLADVALAAGVSKMTASRVLNNTTGFSDKTRVRVLEEVKRLGYVQNRLAAAFSSHGKSTFVGVSIPDLGNEVFTQVLEGIERKLNSAGYQAVLCVSQYDHKAIEEWIETVLSWQPAGLIITGRNHTPTTRKLLKSGGVPVVEIWDLNSAPLDMNVGINHYDSGYAMGQHMVGLGNSRLGYIGTHHDSAHSAAARFRGWKAAVEDGGGSILHSHVLQDTPGFYAGYYGTEQFLKSCGDVDALYYQNDNMAAGGLMFVTSKQLRVPEDIGIAGWGDLPVGAILPKRLTTIHVPNLRLGQKAAEQLMRSISGEPFADVVDVGFHLVPGRTLGDGPR